MYGVCFLERDAQCLQPDAQDTLTWLCCHWALGDSAETTLPIFQDVPENQMAWLKGFGQSTVYILSCQECKHRFSALLFHEPDFAESPGTWDRWRKGRFRL